MRGGVFRPSIWAAPMLLALALLPCVAAAEPPPEADWEAEAFGFLWLSSLKADLQAGSATIAADYSITELLPKLTWGAAGQVGGRYKAFVFSLDALGMQLQDTERTGMKTVNLDPLGGPFGGVNAQVGPNKASIRVTEVMAQATAGFRVVSTPLSNFFDSLPQDDPRRFRLDLLGGARYWYFRNEVRLSIPPATLSVANPLQRPDRRPGLIVGKVSVPLSLAVGGSNAVLETTPSWTDALIGFRVGADVTSSVSVNLLTDYGGFGFGDSSAYTWEVMPSVRWRFADHWAVDASYRAIGFDRNLVSNAVLYGFLLGVGYQF